MVFIVWIADGRSKSMVFIVWIADGRSKIAPVRPGAIRGVPGTPTGRSKERPGGENRPHDGPEVASKSLRPPPRAFRDAPGRPKRAPRSSPDDFLERSVRTCVPRELAERFSVDLRAHRARRTCTKHHCQWCFVHIERFSSERPSDHQNGRKYTAWATESNPDRARSVAKVAPTPPERPRASAVWRRTSDFF